MIPTLHTQRLVLRPAVFEDFNNYVAFLTSPRSKHMGGPFNEREAWGMFCSDIAQWQLFDHGALMIDLKSDDTCIGQVGINHGPPFPEKELGWLIYDDYIEKGYATEASSCLRDWAFSELGLKTLVSYVDRDNAASIKVAKKLGAELDSDAPRPDKEDLVYRYWRN